MPDVIKEIADKVIASMRVDKCSFTEAYNEIIQNYSFLDRNTAKVSVGSELGKRRKRHSRKQKPQPRQMELFLGVSRAQALRDAKAHEASLTAGLPESDL